MNIKKFNLEHAKAGAPVKDSDGNNVTILDFDYKYSPSSANGILVKKSGISPCDHIFTYTKDGTSIWDRSKVLHMAPVAEVEGSPVYIGDILKYNHDSNKFYSVDITNYKHIPTTQISWIEKCHFATLFKGKVVNPDSMLWHNPYSLRDGSDWVLIKASDTYSNKRHIDYIKDQGYYDEFYSWENPIPKPAPKPETWRGLYEGFDGNTKPLLGVYAYSSKKEVILNCGNSKFFIRAVKTSRD